MKPTGKLKIVGNAIRQKGAIAVYVDTILEDEVGSIYKMKASSFLFDLKPEQPTKEKE